MKKIIHIDMDYFYAQVEERDYPELKSRPVAIGGIYNGRGVLCTSNYIARKFGVKSAMPTSKALKLCPQLVLIRPHFEKYKKVSSEVVQIFYEYTDKIQRLSLDEAYLDVTNCTHLNNDAVLIAKEIKSKILAKTGLTASAGVSYNKLLAKIGSDLFKPNGLAILRRENIEKNIADFSVAKINGVGKVTQDKMGRFNIKTFGDLQRFSKLDLINMFGDYGATLYGYCRGVDTREVQERQGRKSLSVEHTFAEDIVGSEELRDKIIEIYYELESRLEKYRDKFYKNIMVKIKYSDFKSTTIESQLEFTLDNFHELFGRRYSERKEHVRLLGLGVKFYSSDLNGQLVLPFLDEF